MEEKLEDYRRAGVELVWYLYPDRRQVEVFSEGKLANVLGESDVLEGGTVLPGLSIPIAELFSEPAAE